MAKDIVKAGNGQSIAPIVDSETRTLVADPNEVLRGDKALLAKLAAAKKQDFRPEMKDTGDFWRPEKVGQELVGLYLGTVQEGRYKRHLVAIEGKEGPECVRVNGTHMLTKSIKRMGKPGRSIKLVFQGEKATEAGNRFFQFDIYWGD